MRAATTDLYDFEESVKEDGKRAVNLDEHVMIWFSSDRGVYYTDDRNSVADDGTIMVKALGKDYQGYVYHVCPVCGHIHYIHQGIIGRNKKIRCRCTKYPVLDSTGKMQRQKPMYIYLDTSELKI